MHSDITERRVTYCKGCGSPFTSVGEALRVIAGKKKTDMQNKILSQKPIRFNNMRSGVMRDGRIFRCKEGCTIIKHNDRIRYLIDVVKQSCTCTGFSIREKCKHIDKLKVILKMIGNQTLKPFHLA